MLARVPDAVFLLAGSGDTFDAIRKEVTDRGREGSVRLLGSLPYDRMPGLCAAADVGLAPFRPEANPLFERLGFYYSPLKIFEYMAAGIPTVTFDVPELARIVSDNAEGRTVSQVNREAFAQAVSDLLVESPSRERMGAQARAKAERLYSWSAHAEQLESFLFKLLTGKQTAKN